MSIKEITVEATHLGKKSNYPQHYDKSVLVAVPRILNREQYNISNENLPFTGVDVWHAYEFSFLLQNGLPVVGTLKISYPCDNEFLVESKSLKLYLNSFNMEIFGKSLNEGIRLSIEKIKNDLSELLKCDVLVTFFNHNAPKSAIDFTDFEILEDLIDVSTINCSNYSEKPELLEKSNNSGEIRWGSHLLRSNCKITNQPDWGAIFIQMKSKQLPTPESIIKYIVSLRNENHFHEEICEMVYKRLFDKFSPNDLMVTCMYTRRGGIDINPIRSLKGNNHPKTLYKTTANDQPIFRQ